MAIGHAFGVGNYFIPARCAQNPPQCLFFANLTAERSDLYGFSSQFVKDGSTSSLYSYLVQTCITFAPVPRDSEPTFCHSQHGYYHLANF